MDVKPVTSDVVAAYITKYCSKEEPFDVVEDNDQVNHYLETRDYSIHEISHYMYGQHITASSTKVCKICICSIMFNNRVLCNINIVQSSENETEIFCENANDHYIARHLN